MKNDMAEVAKARCQSVLQNNKSELRIQFTSMQFSASRPQARIQARVHTAQVGVGRDATIGGAVIVKVTRLERRQIKSCCPKGCPKTPQKAEAGSASGPESFFESSETNSKRLARKFSEN